MHFLGLWTEEFGYRLYNPIEKKLINIRDIVFLEDQTIENMEKDEKSRSSNDIPVNSDPDPDPVSVPINFDQWGAEIE